MTQGCGSLFRSKVVVPVDSTPRGAKIYNSFGEMIGETPTFLRISPNDRDLTFLWPDLKLKTTQKAKCQVSWSRSTIPNLIPSLIGPPGMVISGVFLVSDGLSKGMFDCHKAMMVKVKNESEKKSAKSKKILLLPPYSRSESRSLEIKNSFLARSSFMADELIDEDRAREVLLLHGINSSSTKVLKDINRVNLNIAAAELEATHIVYFDVNISDEKNLVSPSIYDVFSFEEEGKFEAFEFDTKQFSKGHWNVVADLFSFIPNSIQGSYYLNSKVKGTLNQTPSEGEQEFKTNKHPDSVPKFFTLLGLENVENPNDFNLWDFNFGFYPTLSLSAWNLDLNEKVPNYNVSMSSMYGIYNVALTGHAPFGAIRIHFGMGPVLVDWQDSYGSDKTEVQIVSNIGVTYTAFISQRWYFRVGQSTYAISKGVGNNQYFQMKNWEEYHFAFGYYFPSMRYLLRKAIGL